VIHTIDLPCRGCGAGIGEKCRIVPNRTLVRKRIRAGNPIEEHWEREVSYFHAMRERDCEKERSDEARLAEWNTRFAS